MNIKNLIYCILAIVIGTTILPSCKKDPEIIKDPNIVDTTKKDTTTKILFPTILIDASSTADNSTLLPGAEVTINFTAMKGADGKNLATFNLYKIEDGGSPIIIKNETVTNIGKSIFSYSKKINLRTVDKGTDAYKIEIISEDATKSVSKTLTYIIKSKQDTTPELTKPKLISAVTFNSTKQFLATSNGNIYTNSEAQANKSNIDLTYFFSSVSGNNLVSPIARNDQSLYLGWAIKWGTVSTEFRTTNLIKSEFDAYKTKDQKEILTAFNYGVPSNVPNNPTGTRIIKDSFVVGKVIAFKNSLGKYGLIYINSIAANESGASSVDVLVQN